MTITAYAIYCEDIRQEEHNQYSMIGCFKGHIIVEQFPCALPRLAVQIAWMQSRDEQQLPVVARIGYRPHSTNQFNVLAERTLPIDKVELNDKSGELIISEASVVALNLGLAEAGTYGVRLQRGDEEIRLRGIQIITGERGAIAPS